MMAVIASQRFYILARQSIQDLRQLDCHATLAMTIN